METPPGLALELTGVGLKRAAAQGILERLTPGKHSHLISKPNISPINYWAPFFRFLGDDSRGETFTLPDQSRCAGRWALGHYQH
jgi:hypothetical protein